MEELNTGVPTPEPAAVTKMAPPPAKKKAPAKKRVSKETTLRKELDSALRECQLYEERYSALYEDHMKLQQVSNAKTQYTLQTIDQMRTSLLLVLGKDGM